jgi:ABC-type sugar transport system substrate-binding protein
MRIKGNALAAATIAIASFCSVLTGAAAAQEQVTIGFAVPVIANPWWKTNAEFAQKIAADLGVKMLVSDANDQEDRQIKNIEDFIAQGADGIIVAPVTQAVGPGLLKRAEEAKIKMAFAERDPGLKPDEYKGDAYVGFVGADHKASAYASAQTLYDAGARKIVALTGPKGNSVAEARLAAVREFDEEKPDFEIVQFEYGQELREQAQRTTESLLSAHPGPGFDGVWTFNDEAALGAIAALKPAGVLEKVKVAGLDADAGGVKAIEDGEMLSSSGGSYLDGGFATLMLFDAIKGHIPKERWIEMPALVVNQKNVAAYKKNFIESLPPYDGKSLSKAFNPDASTDDYIATFK